MIAKPRREWYTFWNSGGEPVHFLELISPPGFASCFRELAALLAVAAPPDPAAVAALASRYGVELDFVLLGRLLSEHRLRLD